MDNKEDEKLSKALRKVALGYQIAEVTEEYAESDGELRLVKRKKTKKDIPPDLKAVAMLLNSGETDFARWSDEELEKEKKRLLATLAEGEMVEKDTEKSKSTTTKTTVRKPRAKPRKRVVRKSKEEL